MLKKNLCGLFAALFAAGFAGCGGGSRTYTVVDGTMLGTTLHVVADVEGVSSQELYAAVMELDREAKRVGINRQAVIKTWIAERIDRTRASRSA